MHFQNCNFTEIFKFIFISFQFYEKLKYSINQEIELEFFLVKLSKYKDFIRPGTLLKQIKMLQTSFLEKKKINEVPKVEISKTEQTTINKVQEKSSDNKVNNVTSENTVPVIKKEVIPSEDLSQSKPDEKNNEVSVSIKSEIKKEIDSTNSSPVENEIISEKKETVSDYEINKKNLKEIFSCTEYR